MNEDINIYKLSKEKSLIDLVVLSHNNFKTTKQFLSLFYKNTPSKKIHIIWVDNGSSDETVDFLKNFSENNSSISIIFSQKNLGVIEGRNLGYIYSQEYSDSQSKYIMFLDNDQYVQERWFDSYIIFAEKYDVSGIEAWQMNGIFMPICKINSNKQYFSYVGAGGMIFRKDIAKSIQINEEEIFDNRFSPAYFEDPDIIFRSYNQNLKIGWNYKAKILHMPHQTLGNTKDKNRIFIDSLKKFRNKWNKQSVPKIKQVDIL